MSDKLDSALADIYAAVLDPAEGWVRICDLLASLSGGQGAAIVPWRRESRFAGFPISESIIPLVSDYQREKWYLRDTRDLGIPLFRKQAVFTEQHFMTSSDVNRDPMYQELLARHKVPHGACVRIASSEGLYVASVQRAKKNGEFAQVDLDILAELSPHLARAASFSFKLGMDRALGALHAFEQLNVAACILSRDGTVIALNAAANLQIGQWYDVVGGKLTAKLSSDNAALQSLVATSVARISQSQNRMPFDTVLRHPQTHRPLLVQACPMSVNSSDFFSGVAAILLFVDDASNPTSFGTLLQTFYGLTPAEARIAKLLAETLDVSEISEQLSVAPDTVRTHIKAIYQKTGDDSRSGLVSRLVSLRHKIIQ